MNNIYQASDLAVTSMRSLISTIQVDKQVRRWFLHLMLQKALKKELLSNPGVEGLYIRLKNVLIGQKIILVLALLGIAAIVATSKFLYAFGLVFFLLAGFLLERKKKKSVVAVCSVLLKRDFEQEGFAQKTLYQIAEFYSRKYNMVSLVRAITAVQGVLRKVVLYAIIFSTIVYHLDLWKALGAVFTAYYISWGLISTGFFYGRIK